ncbi:MAG: hypothetical protein CEN90_313 [Parcubacteria group bacterium Licking1014_17]|nr:MAG: hypothetical protein CEN90_313 [Parcubacteria group bacterium Licking1014_17]
MIKIAHRINKIADLAKVPGNWGVEIDVRHDNRSGKVYLNHEPGDGDDLDEYLKNFEHAFLIFNIKESGIEQTCIKLAQKHKISKSKYFLLDVEFPYLYRAVRSGIRQIAVRYSEDEPVEMAIKQKSKLDWLWIDTNTTLPLDKKIINKISGFKTCLVSPDRWGRPDDILKYRRKLKKLKYTPDAVMVDLKFGNLWD